MINFFKKIFGFGNKPKVTNSEVDSSEKTVATVVSTSVNDTDNKIDVVIVPINDGEAKVPEHTQLLTDVNMSTPLKMESISDDEHVEKTKTATESEIPTKKTPQKKVNKKVTTSDNTATNKRKTYKIEDSGVKKVEKTEEKKAVIKTKPKAKATPKSKAKPQAENKPKKED